MESKSNSQNRSVSANKQDNDSSTPITSALPKDVNWGETLARRLTFIREWRGMSIPAVARDSHFTVARLNEIEAGMETWLSSSDRQLLALALKSRRLRFAGSGDQSPARAIRRSGAL